MAILAAKICIIGGAIIALPFSLFLLVTALAPLVVRRRHRPAPRRVMPDNARILVVIPAHDESRVVETTVRDALASHYPRESFRVVVIADNCSDNTAEIAERAGAFVIRREHATKRSKGHALEEAFQFLLRDDQFKSFDTFVVIDADTTMAPNLLEVFAEAVAAGTSFAQAYDTVRNRDGNWRTRLMTYAFALINGSYLLGMDRLGLGAHLRGNGMLFTRAGLMRHPWRAASLAEDLEFSWRLRVLGETVHFVPHGTVFAEMPTQAETSRSQRARWEHGRSALRTLMRPLVLAHGSGLKRLGWLLDLYLPPISVLGALTLIPLMLTLALALQGQSSTLLWLLSSFDAACLASYLTSPFLTMGLELRFARSLLYAPYYAIWRILTIAGRSPKNWVRTTRE